MTRMRVLSQYPRSILMGLATCFVAVVLLSAANSALAQSPADWPTPRKVDSQRAQGAGIRELVGTHLRLWTEVPSSPTVDELPRVFDAAVPQWAEYFRVSPERFENWQVQAFLIKDRARFAALGLLPEKNSDYVNGYALGNELWLDEQPSDYYRRHLLLHEGTHSFMLAFLGAGGPGWYMEGTAELFGTHRWEDGKLELRVFPENREAVPMWGRIKLIREAVRHDKALSLPQVLAISNREALAVDSYAWCWALSKFLDSHPKYGERFRQLASQVREPEFNKRFRNLYHLEWSSLQFEWEAFLNALDYRYDSERMIVEHAAVKPPDKSIDVSVEVDRGWQAAPLILRKGRKYQITATGRYQIAHDGQLGPCEPGGVTLRYHDGHPLGMLLGSLRTKSNAGSFAKPVALGLNATLVPDDDAILYLRVNDSPAELSDNKGTLEVRITPVSVGD
jgi:hypothetical protein